MSTFLMFRLLCLSAVLVSATAADAARHSVYRSEDRGRSWVRSDSGLPGHSRVNALAGVDNSIVAATDAGIFVSRDSGNNWETSNVAGTNALRAVAVAVVNGRFFAAADKFMLVSSDPGRTWLTNQTFPSQIVRSLFPHQNALYVGTDANGVYRSADLGRSWTHLANGLPLNAQVLAFTAIENEIFAGLYSHGLYKLQLPEGKWTRIGAAAKIQPLVLASAGTTLVAGHNPGGIYLSRDLGGSWNHWSGQAVSAAPALPSLSNFQFPSGRTSISLDAPVWELASANGILFAGAADGIFYSEDDGRNWSRATAGLPKVSPGVAFLVRSNFVLAATLSNYKSYSDTGAKR